MSSGNPLTFGSAIKQMVKEFDELPLKTETHDKPRVGLVGLMCKADPFKYNWLKKFLEQEEQAEVCPFFFMDYGEMAAYTYVSNNRLFATDGGKWLGGKAARLVKLVFSCLLACSKVMGMFRAPLLSALANSKRFHHPMSFDRLAEISKQFVSAVHSSGEGWMVLGQMIRHLESGVNNLVITTPCVH